MDNELLLKAYKSVESGKSCAFATIIESSDKGSPRKAGSKMVVFEDGSLFGTIGGGWSEEAARKACLKAIKKKKPCLETFSFHGDKSYCGGDIKVFIEPLVGARNFILCGAGHIGLPLSLNVKMLNFHLTVIDDRKEFANPKRFPHADKIIVENPAKCLKKINIQPNDYIMVVTHAHKYDYDCLEAIVESGAAYIGVISSKAKKMKMFADLRKKGIKKKALDRVSIPAGLDIGAQTPEEIALSIASELVSLDNQDYIGSGKFLTKK